MATNLLDKSNPGDHYQSTAMKHAYNLQHQKATRNSILDLIVDIVDLPTEPDSDPAHPLASDSALFKRGLHLFQLSDFDDVVLERNIYDKCGYALCPRPNVKVGGNSQNRIIWGKRTGPAFTIVPKADLEKWCSKECEERALFVCVQLRKEPAWMRGKPTEGIRLLDEIRQENAAGNLENSMKALDIEDSKSVMPDLSNELHKLAHKLSLKQHEKDDVAERLKVLSLERGEAPGSSRKVGELDIVEKANIEASSRPPQPTHSHAGTVEGYRPRKVHFAAESDSEGEDVDLEYENQSSEEGDAMSM